MGYLSILPAANSHPHIDIGMKNAAFEEFKQSMTDAPPGKMSGDRETGLIEALLPLSVDHAFKSIFVVCAVAVDESVPITNMRNKRQTVANLFMLGKF